MNKPNLLLVGNDTDGCTTLAAGLADQFVVTISEPDRAGAAGRALPAPALILVDAGDGDDFTVCHGLHRDLRVPVLVLSRHDSLESRVRAYGCGAADFVATPCQPETLSRKAREAVAHAASTRRSGALHAFPSRHEGAEGGRLLAFMRSAMASPDAESLARALIAATAGYGVVCHVQLRLPGSHLTLTPQGPATPLEAAVIERSASAGRMVSFPRRLLINFDHVSVLVIDPPAEDIVAARIRDGLVSLSECAEGLVESMESPCVPALQPAAHACAAIEHLRERWRSAHIEARLHLEDMVDRVERTYLHLDMNTKQEEILRNALRLGVDHVLARLENGLSFDEQFDLIVDAIRPLHDRRAAARNQPS